jgi:hypothetical protein
LTRAGQVVTAAVSSNGTAWTTVGQDTIALPATALVGLAVGSHDAARLATATFDNVRVSPLPDGWSSADVGAVGTSGSATASGGTFAVSGAGADVWGRADAFHYAYRTLPADGQIVARVATLAGTQPWTKVGVMIRHTLAPNSAHAFMLVSRSQGLAFQRRRSAGAPSIHTAGGVGGGPVWLRLRRAGGVITAAYSANGSTWTVAGSDTLTLSGPVLIGLAVGSHTAAQTATGTFDGVRISP